MCLYGRAVVEKAHIKVTWTNLSQNPIAIAMAVINTTDAMGTTVDGFERIRSFPESKTFSWHL